MATESMKPAAARRSWLGAFGGTVWKLLTATVGSCMRHRVTGLAGEAAFFAILSLPPLIFGLAGSIGYLVKQVDASQVDDLRNKVLELSSRVLTQDSVNAVVEPTVNQVLKGQRFDVISIGFVLALWSGSRALNVFVDTITIMYGLGGRRGIVRTRMLSFTLYVIGLVVGVIVLPLVVAGPQLVDSVLPRQLDVLNLLYWPVVIVLSIAFLTTLYHLSVPVRSSWRHDIPGAMFAFAMWVLGSYLLREILQGARTSIYGPLAAPIAVLLWLYLTALVVLIGAALNASFDRCGLSPPLRGRGRSAYVDCGAALDPRRHAQLPRTDGPAKPTKSHGGGRFTAPTLVSVSRPGTTLEDLGWDDSWREALLSTPPGGDTAPAGEEHGRVVRVDRGLCTVATVDGPIRASLGGAVLEEIAVEPTRAPCAGDWCVVRHWPDGPVTVERLAQRRTSVMRAGAARSSHGQVLAANVDFVGLVVALHPEPNVGRLERLLAVAWQSGATPVILLTKADLVTDGAAVAEEVRAVAPGVHVLNCSAMTLLGVGEIRGMLSGGRTMALVGASGHGKSTLANAVLGCDALTTRPIRDDGRGRHTSVRRELLLVPTGGSVIDTPGLRGVGLQTDPEALDATFADIAGLTMACRFRDCQHLGEPGCAVHAAVGSGALAVRRWESWQKLQRELASAQSRTERRLRAQLGAGWRSSANGPDVRRTRRPG